ncbi:MAG: sensor histidine kinase [Thermoanaerobaculia bacterium]|jgi:signal transduction histidine kinase
MTQSPLPRLQERIKELTALHQTARILQRADASPGVVIERIVTILPAAWQYPAVTEARIRFREWAAATPRFAATTWMQNAVIATRGGESGLIEIAYTEERPPADEGPFLNEERDLIDSLAEMLRSYFERLIAEENIQEAHRSLERQVSERTEDLARANAQLSRRVEEYTEAQGRIERYQVQLRRLASQLAAVEARERRTIAADLHDHIGQALAFIKMNIAQLQANATFCGFETEIAETLVLLNQTIRYTRDLTSQISPPVLYELGLASALRWLGENARIKQKIAVTVEGPTEHRRLADEISATVFKSVQELLTNVVKHSGATSVAIRLEISETGLRVEVSDDGSGFEVDVVQTTESLDDHFGLFSIREQIRYLGGRAEIGSSPGKGTRVSLRLPC